MYFNYCGKQTTLNRKIMMNRLRFICTILVVLLSLTFSVTAQETPGLSKKQSIYVPAYSHIYFGNRERNFLLTVTLSIRNIDPKNSMKLTIVDYYETQGKLIKKLLEKSVTLGPLESVRYVIPEKEKVGGSGANFIVQWESERMINPPIVESIMIGAQSGQGISFISRGRVLQDTD